MVQNIAEIFIELSIAWYIYIETVSGCDLFQSKFSNVFRNDLKLWGSRTSSTRLSPIVGDSPAEEGRVY
jgi:hypothetical protein